MQFRSRAQSLLASEDFRSLFEDDESPVRAKIKHLEGLATNPRKTDHLEMLHVKWKLEGMRHVLELVQEAARATEPEVNAEEPRRFGNLRQRMGRYNLPRGLTG